MKDRGPKDHRNIEILQNMVSGIPLVLGLRTRLWDRCIHVVFGASNCGSRIPDQFPHKTDGFGLSRSRQLCKEHALSPPCDDSGSWKKGQGIPRRFVGLGSYLWGIALLVVSLTCVLLAA